MIFRVTLTRLWGIVMKIVGFVGVESCEMICYLGRLLYKLGKRVLLADCSEFGALMECVPEPHFSREPEAMETPELILEHKGLDYLNYGEYNSFVIGAVAENSLYHDDYDYLLIDFGFKVKHETIEKCDYLIQCCDQHIYNIRRFSGMKGKHGQERYILIRNYVSNGLSGKRILQELKSDMVDENVIILPYNENDFIHSLRKRYPAQDSFNGCSSDMKRVLIDIASKICPDASNSRLKDACRKAASGRSVFWGRKAC